MVLRRVLLICALCTIAFGAFGQQSDWKTVVNVGWSPENAPMASISHGKWVDNHFFLGMGVSFGEAGSEYFIPATFVQGRVNIGKGEFVPFVDSKMGFYCSNITNLSGIDGLYWQPTIGVAWKGFAFGVTGAFLQSSRSQISSNYVDIYQKSHGSIGVVVEYAF